MSRPPGWKGPTVNEVTHLAMEMCIAAGLDPSNISSETRRLFLNRADARLEEIYKKKEIDE